MEHPFLREARQQPRGHALCSALEQIKATKAARSASSSAAYTPAFSYRKSQARRLAQSSSSASIAGAAAASSAFNTPYHGSSLQAVDLRSPSPVHIGGPAVSVAAQSTGLNGVRSAAATPVFGPASTTHLMGSKRDRAKASSASSDLLRVCQVRAGGYAVPLARRCLPLSRLTFAHEFMCLCAVRCCVFLCSRW